MEDTVGMLRMLPLREGKAQQGRKTNPLAPHYRQWAATPGDSELRN